MDIEACLSNQMAKPVVFPLADGMPPIACMDPQTFDWLPPPPSLELCLVWAVDEKLLPKEETTACLLQVDGTTLYKRGFRSPDLRCVNQVKAMQVMEEVHGGSCRNHTGGRALADKMQGYYWPTVRKDAAGYVVLR